MSGPLSGPLSSWAEPAEISSAVANGAVTATAVVEAALDRIEANNPRLNAYTDVTGERALREAAALDAARGAGEALGPLAGVPFAVKNLFDVKGLPTRAGSRINRERPPAKTDAALVRRMNAAGAVLLGTLNMGEYAYDFTGENAHDGPARNPYDTGRMSGGSSSGCGVATTAGLAPISLGSDTNGSLRVPASLCGVFSLKPTYGRMSRAGTFPFVDSLDHVGPFARSAHGLALAYDVLAGFDRADHASAERPAPAVAPHLADPPSGLRTARLSGWFARNADATANAAADAVADALAPLGCVGSLALDAAEAGRAAAYLITNAESAAFHLPRLRRSAENFDPDTRDRFLAGALLPAAWVTRAQRVRRWWLDRALDAFRNVDILVAPATPCAAPLIGTRSISLAGRVLPLRPTLGLLAQPFSCIGLPVATVPVLLPGSVPIGIQIVAAPWREDLCLRVAAFLEAQRVCLAASPSETAA